MVMVTNKLLIITCFGGGSAGVPVPFSFSFVFFLKSFLSFLLVFLLFERGHVLQRQIGCMQQMAKQNRGENEMLFLRAEMRDRGMPGLRQGRRQRSPPPTTPSLTSHCPGGEMCSVLARRRSYSIRAHHTDRWSGQGSVQATTQRTTPRHLN